MVDSNKTIAAHQGRMNTNMIQVGIVKDNRDPKKMGKLKVWIEGSASAQESKSGWITCSYASPFAGNTRGTPNAKKYQDFPKSYGFWAVPPDVGSKVFVFFINGKQEQAYWFGGTFDAGTNSMVPAPSTKIVANTGHDGPIPVIEYDRNSPNSDVNANYVNSPMLDGLVKQNLIHDTVVGSVNRSSRRQAPAQVYGMSTPRGNHIVLDDGYTDAELNAKYWDDDVDDYQNTEFKNPANDTVVGARKCEGVILRTRSGAQIFISESDGFIFIINRDGTARMTMTAEGDIEMLADRDIKLRAKRHIEMRAEGNMKSEVFGNVNHIVHGTTSHEHIGDHEMTCHANSKTNVDGEKRVYAKGTLQLQGDAGVHINSPADINVDSSGTLNLIGSSAVAMNGGGGNATLKGNLSVAMSVSAGGDITSPSSSLDKHTHDNVQNGNGTTPPPKAGSGATPSTTAPAPAEKASSATTTRHEQTQLQDVAAVKVGGKVDNQLQADMGVTQTGSLSAMSAVMPATGTIDSAGYWGPNVKQADGKVADNQGWLITGSGNVLSMYSGYVINRTTNTVQIDHGNSFQSMYKGIKVSDSIQDGSTITTGQVIGTYHGMFLFEVRGINAPLYGFAGTVDPGRFFIEETGIAEAAANKKLTAGKATNTSVEVVTMSNGDSSLVTKSTNKTILSSLVLSGTLNVPNNRRVAEMQYTQSRENQLEQVLSKRAFSDKDGWRVTVGDSTLRFNLVENEGSERNQAALGTFKNGKFIPYSDRTSRAIGYGHNYGFADESRFANGITPAEALDLLAQDTQIAIDNARSVYNDYGLNLPIGPQRVLTEMAYQLGPGGLRGFQKFLRALQSNNYNAAIDELNDSEMVKKQNQGKRVNTYAKQLRPPYGEYK